jgi:DHH family putative phosphoesterase
MCDGVASVVRQSILSSFTKTRTIGITDITIARFVQSRMRGSMQSKTFNELVVEGSAILRREKQIIDDHIRFAREIMMDGHKILAVNATVLFSEIAGELAKDRPFGACYFDRADGKRQWSLRSRDGGVDVSEIAKSHGGGGHPCSAGFTTDI